MSKRNRIPIWDLAKHYPENIRNLAQSLIAISNKEYQISIWVRGEGPEHDFYYECELQFDDEIEFFKKDIRSGELKLSPEQIKAIIRVHVMMDHFDRLPWSFKLPNNPYYHLYIINHPYWQKVRKQAAHALELLKTIQTPTPPCIS
jgi:hypothetical protein